MGTLKLIIYFATGTIETPFGMSDSTWTRYFHNSLAPADDSVSITIPWVSQIATALVACSENDTKVQISDGSVVQFTGYIRKNFDASYCQGNSDIALELVNPSFLLDVELTSPFVASGTTFAAVVPQILELAGVTSYQSISNLDEITYISLEEGANVGDELADLCQQHGYIYDFDTDGIFSLSSIFDEPPDSITQSFPTVDCVGELIVSKKEQEYDGVAISWDTVELKQNALIFSDTTDGNATYKCLISVDPSSYLFGEEDNYCEYDSTLGTVKYAKNARLDWTQGGTAIELREFSNTGLSALLSMYNKSIGATTITKLDIYGDAYIATGTNVQKIIKGKKKTLEVSAKYIFTVTQAQVYAQGLFNWHNYSDYTVTLRSRRNYAPGVFCSIPETSLGKIIGRIVKKSGGFRSSYYDYEIEAVSDPDPSTIKSINRVSDPATNRVIQSAAIAQAAADNAQTTANSKSTCWPSYAAALASSVANDTFIDSANTLGLGAAMLYQCLTAKAATYKRLTIRRYADTATLTTLAALTLIIPGDSCYVTGLGKTYVYTGSWVCEADSDVVMTSLTAPVGAYTGQLGHYMGQGYKWSGSEWVLSSFVIPFGETGYWDFASLVEIPDNVAGTTIRQTGFTGFPTDWVINNSPTFSYTDGVMLWSGASMYAGIFRGCSGYAVVRVKADAGKHLGIGFETGDWRSIIADGDWHCYAFFSNSNLPFVIYAIDANTTLHLSDIYIGTGATDSPVIDNSGDGNHLTVKAVLPVEDKTVGTAAKFNGVTSACYGAKHGLKDNAPFTVSFWFSPASLTQKSFASLWGCGDWNGAVVHGLTFRLQNNSWCVVAGESSSNSTRAITIAAAESWSANEWTHAVAVYDGTTLYAYKNGLLVGSGTVRIAFPFSTFYLGRESLNYENSFFSGTLAHPRIFDHALSANEVQGLYLVAHGNGEKYDWTDYLNECAASDGKIAPAEKTAVLTNWTEINGNGSSTGTYWKTKVAAVAVSVDYTALNTTYQALYALLYTTGGAISSHPVLSAEYWATVISLSSASDYNAVWTAYSDALDALKSAIRTALTTIATTSYDIEVDTSSFVADRAGKLSSGSLVVRAYKTVNGVSTAYSGRWKVIAANTVTSTDDEAAKTLTYAQLGAASTIAITLYASGGTTSALVARSFTVASIASVIPKYLGRYSGAHPTTHYSGDRWLVYNVETPGTGTVARGVYYNNNGTVTLISPTTTDGVLMGYIGEAMQDALWAAINGYALVGTAQDAQACYGTTVHTALAALSGFIDKFMSNDLVVGKTLTSPQYTEVDGQPTAGVKIDAATGLLYAMGAVLAGTAIREGSHTITSTDKLTKIVITAGSIAFYYRALTTDAWTSIGTMKPYSGMMVFDGPIRAAGAADFTGVITAKAATFNGTLAALGGIKASRVSVSGGVAATYAALRSAFATQIIDTEIDANGTIYCDPTYLSQTGGATAPVRTYSFTSIKFSASTITLYQIGESQTIRASAFSITFDSYTSESQYAACKAEYNNGTGLRCTVRIIGQ